MDVLENAAQLYLFAYASNGGGFCGPGLRAVLDDQMAAGAVSPARVDVGCTGQ